MLGGGGGGEFTRSTHNVHGRRGSIYMPGITPNVYLDVGWGGSGGSMLYMGGGRGQYRELHNVYIDDTR